MSGERFTLDTNILVYSIDNGAGARHEIARRVVGLALRRDCRLTLQAVSEFYAVATRKGRMPPAEAAAQANDWLLLFPSLAGSPSAVRTALASTSGSTASFWDALLIASAAEGGCTAIVTEDLADGSLIGGVRVVNPFAGEVISPAALSLLSP
jgi:predicted nucleic acid-binding protein